MNTFTYSSYKTFLKDFVGQGKGTPKETTFASLATAARVQRSYLSQVLNGDSHLSSDHLYLICRYLQLSKDETDYLLIILEIDRSTLLDRKEELRSQLSKFQRKNLRSEKPLGRTGITVTTEDLSTYYGNPIIPIIHMFLTIPLYQKDFEKLEKKLNISKKRLSEYLTVLERCGLIRVSKDSVEVIQPHLHLKQESPLARTNAALFRLRSIDQQQKSEDLDDYFFTATFSADENTRIQIKTKLLSVLKEISSLVNAAPCRDVFQMNLDLFKY